MKKQTKIIISVVLSCTILLLLFIPSFASDSTPALASDDSVLIPAGTYTWNDNVTKPSFTGLGVEWFINFTTSTITIEGTSFGEWGIMSVINYPDDKLLIYSPTDNTDNAIPVWSLTEGWNTAFTATDGAFPQGYGKTVFISEDTYVPSDVAIWLNSNWERYVPDYNGNPFTDIMNMVVEALDIPLFGTFSLWDMLTTLCGLFAVVWLLKLLSGG